LTAKKHHRDTEDTELHREEWNREHNSLVDDVGYDVYQSM